MDGMGWPSFMDGHVLFGSTDGNLYVVSADSGVSGGASKPLIADNATVTVTSVGGFMDTLHRDKGSYVVSRSVRVDASTDPQDPGLPTVSSDGISLFSNANGICLGWTLHRRTIFFRSSIPHDSSDFAPSCVLLG